MVQIWVAHTNFIAIVKKIDQNIKLRNQQMIDEAMKNIIAVRFQKAWRNYL